MKKKYYTMEEAKRMDKLIFELAFYEVTSGLLPLTFDYENIMKWNEKATKKFNEFKLLLRMGEYTLEELERDVVNRNSPMPPQKLDLSDDLDSKIVQFEKEEDEREASKGLFDKDSFLSGFMGQLFPDLGKESAFDSPDKTAAPNRYNPFAGTSLGGFGLKKDIEHLSDDEEEDDDDDDDDDEGEDGKSKSKR